MPERSPVPVTAYDEVGTRFGRGLERSLASYWSGDSHL
jgi:hypothetical protein